MPVTCWAIDLSRSSAMSAVYFYRTIAGYGIVSLDRM